MKKIFHGIEYEVCKEKKIEGDFIEKGVGIYFENDVEITGSLECKYLKCAGSINVRKDYVVECYEEIGGAQEVGGSQKVGESQKVGGYQEVEWSQEVGGYQKVGESQKVGGYQ